MTWVKVCGLTREEDVSAAVTAGADAIGLIMVRSSPRRITEERVAELARGVAATRVVLTEGLTPSEASDLLERTGTNAIQVYGKHREDVASELGAAGFLVLYPSTPAGLAGGRIPHEAVPLLDTPSSGRLGGTGLTFDWGSIGEVSRPIVIAGGLGPDNVRDAIRESGAWGVDASSRLEVAPGIKDPVRVAAFVEEAKSE